MSTQQDIPSGLKDLFDDLKRIPPRDTILAAQRRANFLSQADSFRQAVSLPAHPRLNKWKLIKFRKDGFAMNGILAVVLAAALAFGGAGTAVFAAQDDLPTQPLYPLKTGIEDLRLWLNQDPQNEIDMLLEMTRTRAQEMIRVAQQGDEIPLKTRLRLEMHVNQALQQAAELGNPEMDAALLRIHTSLQNQEQLIHQAQIQAGPEAGETLLQTRTMLLSRIHTVEAALIAPEGFKNTIRNEEQNQFRQENSQGPVDDPPPSEAPPNPSNGPQPDPGGKGKTDTPGPTQNGNGPSSGGDGSGSGNKP